MSEAIRKQVPVSFSDGRLALDFHMSANAQAAFLTMFVGATPDDWRSMNFRNKSVTCVVEKGISPVLDQKVTIASRSNPCIIEPFHLYVGGSYEELNAKPAILEVTQYIHAFAKGKYAHSPSLVHAEDPNAPEPSLPVVHYDFLAEALEWFQQYTSVMSKAIKKMEGQDSVKGTRWTLEQDEDEPPLITSTVNLHGMPLNLKKVIPDNLKYWDMDKFKERARKTPLLHLCMGQTTHATFMKEA